MFHGEKVLVAELKETCRFVRQILFYLDDELSPQIVQSGRRRADATHKRGTHPAFLPTDKTQSLQLIRVCGWYSLGTCNPDLCCLHATLKQLLFLASFWIRSIKMATTLPCNLQANLKS